MHTISRNNLSSVILQAYNVILSDGHYRPSRNGGCTSIFDTTFELTNPRARHLQLDGRKSNIFSMIAETFWVMAGDDKVDPYLSFFLPRAPQYSDDGLVWAGAYGPRMYAYDQLTGIVDMFKEDMYTRRAIVSIHDSSQDSVQSVANKFGDSHKVKDVPCNLLINFYVEGDNSFCAKVIQRSGDIIFGTGSINPFEFSFLHELMFNEVKKIHPELELGPYRWHVTNAHLYDFTKAQAESVVQGLSNYQSVGYSSDSMVMTAPSVDKWQPFFSEVVALYTEVITAEDENLERVCGSLSSHLGHLMVAYGIPLYNDDLESNMLWTYMQVVAYYVCSKRGFDKGTFYLLSENEEFNRSIVDSSFLNFKVEVL